MSVHSKLTAVEPRRQYDKWKNSIKRTSNLYIFFFLMYILWMFSLPCPITMLCHMWATSVKIGGSCPLDPAHKNTAVSGCGTIIIILSIFGLEPDGNSSRGVMKICMNKKKSWDLEGIDRWSTIVRFSNEFCTSKENCPWPAFFRLPPFALVSLVAIAADSR